jgi:hypothetical protein
MDIIQLECLSQSSSVLKIIAGPIEGKIWIENGEVIDAVAGDSTGEEAFRIIAGWRGGNFEILPADQGRKRTIHHSYHALLLETAQAIDEAQQHAQADAAAEQSPTGPSAAARERKAEAADARMFDASRIPGVEFIVAADVKDGRLAASWGLEHPEQVGDWLDVSINGMQGMADRFQWGELRSIEGKGVQRNIAVVMHKDTALAAGWERSMAWSQVREGMKKILVRWLS